MALNKSGMKKFLACVAFVFLAASFVAAQGSGGWNGNGNEGNDISWSSGAMPSIAADWLNNGGQLPQPLAMLIIHEAKDAGLANFGLSLGQMIHQYNQGLLTIELVATMPPSLTFRLISGGGTILVVIDAL